MNSTKQPQPVYKVYDTMQVRKSVWKDQIAAVSTATFLGLTALGMILYHSFSPKPPNSIQDGAPAGMFSLPSSRVELSRTPEMPQPAERPEEAESAEFAAPDSFMAPENPDAAFDPSADMKSRAESPSTAGESTPVPAPGRLPAEADAWGARIDPRLRVSVFPLRQAMGVSGFLFPKKHYTKVLMVEIENPLTTVEDFRLGLATDLASLGRITTPSIVKPIFIGGESAEDWVRSPRDSPTQHHRKGLVMSLPARTRIQILVTLVSVGAEVPDDDLKITAATPTGVVPPAWKKVVWPDRRDEISVDWREPVVNPASPGVRWYSASLVSEE